MVHGLEIMNRKIIKTGEVYKGEISLVIKQNFLTIKITSITNKFKNYSYSEELICKR